MTDVRKPKVGEIVRYFPQPDEDDALANGGVKGGLPAIVTQAWNDQTVNLRVIQDSDDSPLWRTSVLKLNEPELTDMEPVAEATSAIRRGWIFND